MRLSGLVRPAHRIKDLHCSMTFDAAEKLQKLSAVRAGYVVTGGAAMPWYGSNEQLLNISEISFEPPPNWSKVFEWKAEKTPWRQERLVIWKIAETAVE